MCLITNNYKGFISDRNICVIKEVFKERYIYSTPYKGAKVTLDNYLVPDKAIPSIYKSEYKQYIIEGGVIHSYALIDPVSYYWKPSFVAIIPKGCRYWIGKNNDICSEVLFITSIRACNTHLKDIEESFNDHNSYLYKKYNPLIKKYKRSVSRKIIYTLFKLL